jgi:hypothetical protein
VSIEGFSSQNSLHEYAKVGLAPTGRGYAGNIVLGDIIVQVDGKPVSSILPIYCMFKEMGGAVL